MPLMKMNRSPRNINIRALLMLLAAAALVSLSACGGGYSCNITFGSSTCSQSGTSVSGNGGAGGGGGGSSTPTAFAFAVDQNGTLDGYTLNATAGTFAATPSYTAPTIPTNSGGVGMVLAQEQYLYAGFGSVGELYGWTIDPSGNLTAISGSPFSAPFLGYFGAGVGETDMTTNPAGTLLFISDTLQGAIYVFQIGSGGVLTAATGSPFAVPFEPMNLATDGQGKYLYAINGTYTTHTGTAIAAYAIGSGGNLTPVTGSPFIYPMWEVRGEPTGQYLIGTSGSSAFYSGSDDDHLYVFAITQSGTSAGAIAPVSGSPFTTTYSPFTIAVQPNSSGNLIYSFGFNDTATAFNPIEGYEITAGTGALTAVSGSPFSNVANGSWGQFDQSGTLLFVYSSYLNASTNAVTTQLGPLGVASGGALTQPDPTLTLITPGFWSVTDPQ